VAAEGNTEESRGKSLGKVRTEQVKRLAKELVRRFPDRFSADFKTNKESVNIVVSGITPKVRNKVAGYIVQILSQAEISSSDNVEEEVE